jgi:hypothetical protein
MTMPARWFPLIFDGARQFRSPPMGTTTTQVVYDRALTDNEVVQLDCQYRFRIHATFRLRSRPDRNLTLSAPHDENAGTNVLAESAKFTDGWAGYRGAARSHRARIYSETIA